MSDEAQTPQEPAPDAEGWAHHTSPDADLEQDAQEEATGSESRADTETDSGDDEAESTGPVASSAQDDDGPAQLPLEKWSEHKLAEAGIELANHLHKLKVYEEAERKHKRHYKDNHDRMVDVIEGLRLRIREQRHALGIDEGPEPGDEEEE